MIYLPVDTDVNLKFLIDAESTNFGSQVISDWFKERNGMWEKYKFSYKTGNFYLVIEEMNGNYNETIKIENWDDESIGHVRQISGKPSRDGMIVVPFKFDKQGYYKVHLAFDFGSESQLLRVSEDQFFNVVKVQTDIVFDKKIKDFCDFYFFPKGEETNAIVGYKGVCSRFECHSEPVYKSFEYFGQYLPLNAQVAGLNNNILDTIADEQKDDIFYNGKDVSGETVPGDWYKNLVDAAKKNGLVYPYTNRKYFTRQVIRLYYKTDNGSNIYMPDGNNDHTKTGWLGGIYRTWKPGDILIQIGLPEDPKFTAITPNIDIDYL